MMIIKIKYDLTAVQEIHQYLIFSISRFFYIHIELKIFLYMSIKYFFKNLISTIHH